MPGSARRAGRSAAALSLCDTGFAIRRAVQTPISSTSRRLFSSSVRPVAVRSTMPSTSPVSGASSTEPLTSTISAWRPVPAKCSAATRGYLVAMRTRPRRRSASRDRIAPLAGRHDHAAAAVVQVEQLVDLAVGLLEQHVLAGDADVGRAVLHVGGHVAGAHRHDPGPVEEQLAVVRADLRHVEPEPLEQVERPAEERAARHRHHQPVAHRSASSAAWAWCTRWTSRATPHAGQRTPEAPEQVVVAAAAAEGEAHGGVVDLEHGARCSSRAREPARGRRSRGRPLRARPAGRSGRAGRATASGTSASARSSTSAPPRSSGRRTSRSRSSCPRPSESTSISRPTRSRRASAASSGVCRSTGTSSETSRRR